MYYMMKINLYDRNKFYMQEIIFQDFVLNFRNFILFIWDFTFNIADRVLALILISNSKNYSKIIMSPN